MLLTFYLFGHFFCFFAPLWIIVVHFDWEPFTVNKAYTNRANEEATTKILEPVRARRQQRERRRNAIPFRGTVKDELEEEQWKSRIVQKQLKIS